ncbi:SH3 domain-containing protein [Allorhizobium sp. BGMRC 0089]|uniref:SH3 domain-containing protein n=1 Tax=Allorhizobium sonneratiae TaxID=2934936 RepID=UPI002033B96C|nr:SH3 domain-containing protein [Allorhizobium sonneratiae]MCM2294487.1 SH3 domain-containing protein [Allorhizobium sonneratiae]
MGNAGKPSADDEEDGVLQAAARPGLSRRCLLTGLMAVAMASAAQASMDRKAGRVTGLPLPRFVSLKSDKARMRAGPSFDYPIRWVYEAKGLPVEILEEYGNWRQVRDCDGVSGWMNSALLSGKRTGLAAPWRTVSGEMIDMHAAPGPLSQVMAKLQPRVRLNVHDCDGHWCEVSVQNGGPSGYIRQSLVWGVYPAEIIGEKDPF